MRIILFFLLLLSTSFVVAQSETTKDTTSLEYDANKLKGTVNVWLGRDFQKEQYKEYNVLYIDSLVKRINTQESIIKELYASLDSIKRITTTNKEQHQLIQQAQINQTYALYDASPPINFKVNDAQLSGVYRKKLDELAAKFKSGNYQIRIIGHADYSGSASLNNKLSYKRAVVVSKYLTKQHGINHKKITLLYLGSSCPVTSSKSKAENKKRSRRTDVFLIPVN